MSLLLDTQALLWALSGDERLSPAATEAYENAPGGHFSMVSLWEIGIKLGLRRADFALASGWERRIPEELVRLGFSRIDVEPRHCRMVAELPLHHRDSFDRMLVTQAMAADCPILSSDRQLDAYPIRRIW